MPCMPCEPMYCPMPCMPCGPSPCPLPCPLPMNCSPCPMPMNCTPCLMPSCPPPCPLKVTYTTLMARIFQQANLDSQFSFENFQRCKSRELRASLLVTQCECVKRNGLQLDCPRKECRGRPMCSTKPIPSCCPSKYMWRYANVTMGKASYNVPKRGVCCPKSGDCNPCVVKCQPAVCFDCEFSLKIFLTIVLIR